jgi:hypothetical protein
MRTHSKAIAAALLVTLAGTSGAQQQQSSGPRFQAWVGCWSGARDMDGLPLIDAQALVCITPTSDANVVKVATIVEGKVVSTHELDASGRERALEAKGCTGVRSATWSADERRIFLKSSARCGDLSRTTSGILSMTANGEWLDVQQVSAGGADNIRVMRYRDAGVPKSVPEEIASALSGLGLATQSARIAAGAAIGRTAVLEASRTATPAVVEAWVLERGQPFALDARELIALADAGVSPRVTDAMIAVSNPQEFAVAHGSAAPQRMGDTTMVVGQRLHVYLDRYDPWSWGYDPYGYSMYGYRRDPFLGYNGYGYGGYGYGGGYYGSPVIVVTGPDASAPHGRRVKGEGYHPPASTNASPSRTASDRNSGSSSSSSGSSSSGSSSSGSSKEPAPSSTRTAQPKP